MALILSKAEKALQNSDAVKDAMAAISAIIPEFKQFIENGGKAIDFKFNKQQISKINKVPNGIATLQDDKLINIDSKKNMKEIFYEFFGMNETWKVGRNVLGGFMVHAPEYPTYLIPAYTQAKATGDASELKKGEGPRGLITGALEGVAVGALVSGRNLKFREMGPFIILGAALQMFSCKVFPFIAEKVGQYEYKKNQLKKQALPNNGLETTKIADIPKPASADSKKPAAPAFKGANPYAACKFNGLRV